MPIDSKVGNEKGSVGKMQIKGVTMGTSHGLPPPDTSHSEQRRINCLLTWTQDPS